MTTLRTMIAILAASILGVAPARAQKVGDQIVCIGKLFTETVSRPRRVWIDKDIVHLAIIWDEVSGDRCFIDQDSLPSWPCRAGNRCRVAGILAERLSSLDLIVSPDHRHYSGWLNRMLTVASAQRLGAAPKRGAGP